jgi:hypothetical protein
MGTADKLLRAFIAALIAILFVQKIITGWIAVVFLIAAGILVLTSLVRFCPIYSLFGIRTCPNTKS